LQTRLDFIGHAIQGKKNPTEKTGPLANFDAVVRCLVVPLLFPIIQ